MTAKCRTSIFSIRLVKSYIFSLIISSESPIIPEELRFKGGREIGLSNALAY